VTKSIIENLIANGHYAKAMSIIDSNVTPTSIILKSRIYELTGHFEKAISTAEEIYYKLLEFNNPNHTLEAISALCYGLWRIFDFSKARQFIANGNKMLENGSNDQINFSAQGTFNNIQGLILWKQNHLKSALQKFRASLEFREKSSEPSPISYSLNNIGNTYLLMDDMPKAKFYYNKSLELRKINSFKPGIASSHNSLARYSEKINDYDQALNYHNLSLKLWKEIGNTQFIAKSYRFLGRYYSKINEKDLAQQNYQNAVKLFQSLPNKTDLNITTNLLSKL
jgi:tetratricopeptide (TPR) repeat protein